MPEAKFFGATYIVRAEAAAAEEVREFTYSIICMAHTRESAEMAMRDELARMYGEGTDTNWNEDETFPAFRTIWGSVLTFAAPSREISRELYDALSGWVANASD